jgi:hypothetical protein
MKTIERFVKVWTVSATRSTVNWGGKKTHAVEEEDGGGSPNTVRSVLGIILTYII